MESCIVLIKLDMNANTCTALVSNLRRRKRPLDSLFVSFSLCPSLQHSVECPISCISAYVIPRYYMSLYYEVCHWFGFVINENEMS